MAIESTLNQQRKYLRCHMKPALFLQSKKDIAIYTNLFGKRRIAYMIIVICYSLIVFRS